MLRTLLARLDQALCFCEATFVGLALAGTSVLLFVNVIMRYVFLAAIPWAEEVTMYGIVWLVFVGGSVALRTQGHIAIDLLPLALSPAGERRLRILVAALMLAFFAVFFYYSGLHTLRIMATGQVTPMLDAPMWLTYLAMPAGSLLMGVRTAQILHRAVRGESKAGAALAAAAD